LQLKHYWQLNEPVFARSTTTLAERLSGLGELSQFAAEMQGSMDSVLDVFPKQPPKGLHIIVQKPLGESYVDLYVVKCPANVVLLSTFSTYVNRTLTMSPSTHCFFTFPRPPPFRRVLERHFDNSSVSHRCLFFSLSETLTVCNRRGWSGGEAQGDR